jgi:hypothetical protein
LSVFDQPVPTEFKPQRPWRHAGELLRMRYAVAKAWSLEIIEHARLQGDAEDPKDGYWEKRHGGWKHMAKYARMGGLVFDDGVLIKKAGILLEDLDRLQDRVDELTLELEGAEKRAHDRNGGRG